MAETKFPVPKFMFSVNIDGEDVSFQEVSGLDVEYDYIEYRDGSTKFETLRRVGKIKPGMVSMKRGIFKGDSKMSKIFEFFNKLGNQKHGAALKSFTITVKLLDEKGKDVMIWEMENAVPVKLSSPALNSESNELAIEQIDFAHSGIKITKK